MYTPRAFVDTDLARLDALVARDPFVTLVTVDGDGAPQVTHLPVLYRRDGGRVLVEGHWARPNPQARHDGAALVIVHGPHAYVSPGWYPDKEEQARVPTWNYVVAHLHGTLERFEDEAGLADLVMRLSDRFEQALGSDWAFEPEREDHRVQLRGIVGFRFVPERIELKSKLSQNHPEANRRSVADALRALPDPGANAIAALMRAREP
ncbi:FMN-binding negative transcriptional regulator [Luteimonas lutimaris]|uniref:FMN-binding negative transcriptional regulator n=1 Tax=Luteimonas lutimaris TaxID=698645 RepID=A0ABP7MA09_9GAMM